MDRVDSGSVDRLRDTILDGFDGQKDRMDVLWCNYCLCWGTPYHHNPCQSRYNITALYQGLTNIPGTAREMYQGLTAREMYQGRIDMSGTTSHVFQKKVIY